MWIAIRDSSTIRDEVGVIIGVYSSKEYALNAATVDFKSYHGVEPIVTRYNPNDDQYDWYSLEVREGFPGYRVMKITVDAKELIEV